MVAAAGDETGAIRAGVASLILIIVYFVKFFIMIKRLQSHEPWKMRAYLCAFGYPLLVACCCTVGALLFGRRLKLTRRQRHGLRWTLLAVLLSFFVLVVTKPVWLQLD